MEDFAPSWNFAHPSRFTGTKALAKLHHALCVCRLAMARIWRIDEEWHELSELPNLSAVAVMEVALQRLCRSLTKLFWDVCLDEERVPRRIGALRSNEVELRFDIMLSEGLYGAA